MRNELSEDYERRKTITAWNFDIINLILNVF